MWKSLSIAAKIWISFSLLVLGYCGSIVLGFRLGKQTEERLQTASESLFRAATESQVAQAAFHEQIRFYTNAVSQENSELLDLAREKDALAQNALQTILTLQGIVPQQRQQVNEVLQQLKGFAKSAQIVYTGLSSSLDFNPEEKTMLEGKAMELAEETVHIQDALVLLTTTFSDALKEELLQISQATKWSRYVEGYTFIGVVFTVSLITALFIRGSIVKPLKHLTGIASKIAMGDLSGQVEVASQDEFGMLARAFRDMMTYMQNVAQVAQKLAVGEIHVHLKPQSKHDVLNQAFAETVRYMQEVTDIARRISHKDLHVVVTPKSEQDVLNRSLQRMVGNLQEMMDEIQSSIQAVQQQHWIRTGQTELNEQIRGEQDVATLANRTISYLARYVNAQIGAIYVLDDTQHSLDCVGRYALPVAPEHALKISVGQGLVGQVAREQRRIIFDNVPPDYLHISSGFTDGCPSYLLIEPFLYEQQLKGVIELGAVHRFSDLELEFIGEVSESIAIAFHSAQERVKMQALLEKTQHQAMELLAQQEQLEDANAELRKAEEELRRTNVQLQEASQHKTDFLANMSHELRTPLNAIIGFTSLTIGAVKDQLAPEHLENLKKAEKAARLLLQLISDILDFSKIEAGRMETVLEDVAIDAVIEDVAITAEGLLVDSAITLNTHVAPELPVITSDYLKLKQILNNLVSNAIKFTKEGGVTIRAEMVPATTDQEAFIQLDVEDTGCGIPEDRLEHVFEAFKQGDSSIRKKFGGTGLGLAITKKLCESLHIHIGLSSQVDKGTRFRLQIPLACPATPSALEQTSVVASPAAASSPAAAPEGVSAEDRIFPNAAANAMVLCFSQNADTCAEFQASLQEFPLEVRKVASVSECVTLAKEHLVWSILIDEESPETNALRQLKHVEALAHIPLIVCSRHAKGNGHHAGWLEHLCKPFAREELLKVLLRVTQERSGDILAVDDDANIRTLYRRMLTDAGYTPHIVQNGIEALEFLHTHALPQAMLLDLLMPGMDGFQVLEQLQAHDGWRRIPVIVITGKTLSAEERKLMQARAKLVVEKNSMPIQELPRKIEAVIHDVATERAATMLVVDDNQMNLDLIAGVLRQAGYLVYTADSGAHGVDAAQRLLPDAVLMDLGMPDMDGFEATRLLKQQPITADIPVIACSAFATKDFQKRAFQAGCIGYITKPIEPEQLVEQLVKLMITAKIRQQLHTFTAHSVTTHERRTVCCTPQEDGS